MMELKLKIKGFLCNKFCSISHHYKLMFNKRKNCKSEHLIFIQSDTPLKEDRFKYNALFPSYSKNFVLKNKIFPILSLSKYNFLMVPDRAKLFT